MRKLSLLLIIGVIAGLLLPLNVPAQPVDVLANGTKIVLDNGVVTTYLGKTAEGKNLWQAVIGSPLYLDDLVTPIYARWQYDSEKKEWYADANLFTAIAKDTKVTVWYNNTKLSWQPDVFVGTKKQDVYAAPQLIIYDPINDNYIGNTLQWQYGNITRNVRLIEGMLQEHYIITENPGEDILIISHSEKDAGFIWTRPAIAWDSEGKPLNLTIDGDDVTLTVAAMVNATFPITIDPDTTFTGTAKDGYIRYDGEPSESWATVRGATTGTSVNDGSSYAVYSIMARAGGSTYYDILRSFFYFDTSSLPDGAEITSATLRLRNCHPGGADVTASIQQGTQAATLTTADYDSFSGTEFGHYTWTDYGYGNITFNAAGRAAINLTGTTKLCARQYTKDYGDITPGYYYYGLGTNFYEAGSGSQPILVVTYEASATPDITTLAATKIAVTTTRLNAYLGEDGGEPCDVRFQYANHSCEAEGNYTVNTTWVNDTYWKGDSIYLDIANLTNSTTYYCRAQARNTQGTVSGSELTFTTGSGVTAPSNLTAYPSSNSISLSWIKGENTTNTVIRGQVGSYPTVGWVWFSPTGFVDVDSNWTNETNAYDDDVDTFAGNVISADSWGSFLNITQTTQNCSAIRFNAYQHPSRINKVDVDVLSNGTWTDVYNGTFTWRTWMVKSLNGTFSVAEARIRFYSDFAANYTAELYEFDFYNAADAAAASGDLVYSGTMSTATHSNLTPGTSYFYRAWGESGGVYTDNYSQTVGTTYAGVTAPSDPDAPDVPPGWYGVPDYTNMENFLFYGMVNDLADGLEMPRNSFWIIGAMLMAAGIAIAVYWKTHSGVAGLLAGGVLVVIFSLQFGVPLWIIFAFGVLVAGVFIVVRRA